MKPLYEFSSGFQTSAKPKSWKSLQFTVAISVTPWHIKVNAIRASKIRRLGKLASRFVPVYDLLEAEEFQLPEVRCPAIDRTYGGGCRIPPRRASPASDPDGEFIAL